MKTAIVLHGMMSKDEYFDEKYPSPSNFHWLPWLQRQLILHGILAQTPEIPEPYTPNYEKWCSVFEQFPVDEDTMLIGHSCGGGFLVRWLSEHKVKVGKVALVAPWIDPTKKFAPAFFDFTIDDDVVARTQGMALFISHDDDKEELDSAEILKAHWPTLELKEFSDKGHFTLGAMKTVEFPELRDWLVK